MTLEEIKNIHDGFHLPEHVNWLVSRVEKLTKVLNALKTGAEGCLCEEDEEDIGMDPQVVIEDITKALEET